MTISFVKWQPWQDVENVRNQLDQLFEEMTPIARETFVQQRPVRVPPIELLGTDNDLILKVELPGLEGKDLDIQVTREAVSIKGVLQRSGSALIPVPDGSTKKVLGIVFADQPTARLGGSGSHNSERIPWWKALWLRLGQ